MGWTNTQKQIAARACKSVGISDEQRRDVILRNFANARMRDGTASSTSTKLTNHDFEQFMAVVEGYAGGKVLHFSAGYWREHADGRNARLRHRAAAIAAALESAGVFPAGGDGLAGWISKRVTDGATDRLDDLDYHGLMALILGLQAFARQRDVALAGLSRRPKDVVHV